MNYSVLIQNRRSVRAFSDKRVSEPALQELRSFFAAEAKRLLPGLNTELHIFGDGVREALEDAAGYHKYLVGAPHYLVLLSEAHPSAALNAGYIMEDMVLKLSDMELSACWVTFADGEEVKAALGLDSPLDVAAIVAFGFGQKTTRRLRLNIRTMSDVDVVAKHRYMEPKLSIDELVSLNSWGSRDGLREHIGFYDDMLWESFYAASLAPSYLNRQAYGFLIHEGGISLVSKPDDYTTRHDGELSLGAVLLHFSAVLGSRLPLPGWKLGDEAARLPLPEGHSVVATLPL